MAPKIGARKSLQRPFSLDMTKRQRRRKDSSKPPDDTKAIRRRKIIAEFYETERAYVEGLDLIYSVRTQPFIVAKIANTFGTTLAFSDADNCLA